MSTLLVTTGATVTFKELVRNVLRTEFIRGVIDKGFKEVFVQYGNEIKDGINQSEVYVKQIVEELNESSQLNFESHSGKATQFSETNLTCFTSSKLDQFSFIIFPFSNYIDEFIKVADVVISHAGTGSIVDALKLHKKLIVVINDQLMDNHQAEVAEEFNKQGYCTSLTTADINDSTVFLRAIDNSLISEPKQFTTNNSSVVESIIYEELAS